MQQTSLPAEENGPPEAILDAALDEFADRGFAGARIDEIARRAGVNKAGLYYHVGNKETLYLLSLRRLFSPLAHILGSPLSADTPQERLQEHVARFAEGVVADPRFAQIMLRELANRGVDLPGEILAVMVASLKRLTGIVNDGVATGIFRPVPPPLLQFMLVGALNLSVVTAPMRDRAATEGLVTHGEVAIPDAGERARQLADLILNGILADRKE